MLSLINADAEDDDTEISDPQEIAELFAAVAEVAMETFGVQQTKLLFEAVMEQEGRDPH